MASGTNSVDTSLNFDLNTIPLWLRDDEILEKELANDFNDAGMKFSSKEEAGGLMEELNKMSVENKKLSEMLMLMCESYNTLQSQMMELKSKNPDKVSNISRKRKAESDGNSNQNGTNGNMENSFSDEESCKKPREEFKTKISRAYVRTDPSDSSLIVKDGYQWRKYGQKVTRDNPCPRAYYKCSFAPSCPVKKKVQRSVDDRSILVATYEGEHNHPHSSQTTAMLNLTNGVTISSVPCLAPVSSLSPSIPLDLIQPRPCHEVEKTNGEIDLSVFQQFLVDQMAFSLSKDPSFKAALATAISGRIQQLSPANNW